MPKIVDHQDLLNVGFYSHEDIDAYIDRPKESREIKPTCGQVFCTAETTITTNTLTDITGATVTLTVPVKSKILVWASFDTEILIASSIGIGSLIIDGTEQFGAAIFSPITVNSRTTMGQHWIESLSVGSHTIKLQGRTNAAAGQSIKFYAAHTNFAYLIVKA